MIFRLNVVRETKNLKPTEPVIIVTAPNGEQNRRRAGADSSGKKRVRKC